MGRIQQGEEGRRGPTSRVQQPCLATSNQFWAYKILSPTGERGVEVSDGQERGVGRGKAY